MRPAAAEQIMPRAQVRSPPPAAAQPGIGNGTVALYIVLAFVALLPGLAGSLGYEPATDNPLAPWLAWLQGGLRDVRFGSGLRFWLGVTGAGMMSLLVLYPLRKAFPNGRCFGSIRGWFHLHILIGLFGPVIILYHCNFGHGGANANVALWSMLALAASGIAGQFIYRRANAEFYGDRDTARRHLDAIAAALDSIEQAPEARARIIAELAALDEDLLTPRRGIAQSLRARLGLERRMHVILRATVSVVDTWARHHGADTPTQRRVRAGAVAAINSYFRLVRRAASRSVREQFWARWRLFHLPVFLIMLVAVVLHVAVVWNMESRMPQSAGDTGDAARAGRSARDGIQQVRRATIRIEPKAVEVAPPGAVEKQAPMPPARSTAPHPSAQTAPASVQMAEPRAATRPAPIVAPTARAAPDAEPQVAAAKDSRKPAALVRPVPVTPPAVSPAKPTEADVRDVYAELQRRTEAQVMGLGAPKPHTLAEQIAHWRERMTRKEFAHAEHETGFPLVGKHLRVDCASCHKTPIAEVRRASTRQCVDCHKGDDPHRGRRPVCAMCHSPEGWGHRKK